MIRTTSTLLLFLLLGGFSIDSTFARRRKKSKLKTNSEASIFSSEDDYLVLMKPYKRFSEAHAFTEAREGYSRLLNAERTTSSHHLEEEIVLSSHETVARVKFASQEDLDNARTDPDVLAVEPDYVAHSTVSSWGLDRIDGVMDNVFTSEFTGKDVFIYVIDTGINEVHNDFAGRVEPGANFVSPESIADCNGHGTHCASTALGTVYGVAKAANLVGVKVLNCAGSGYYSWVISGVNWAVNDAKARGVRGVLSLSLGGPVSVSLNHAIDSAVAAGLAVTVAAGNDDNDACKYSPASATSALTVGSTTNKDARSWFSNFGSCVDLFAPGSSIKAAYIGSKTKVKTLSGTSMATPHVAGILALAWEQFPELDAVALMEHVVRISAADQISDTMNSPNLLAMVPTETTTTPPPTPKPTEAPTEPLTDAPSAAPTFKPDTPGCSNSCAWAGDGICDDGGVNSDYNFCGLGTDCADCGPREVTSAPTTSAPTTQAPTGTPTFKSTTIAPTAKLTPKPTHSVSPSSPPTLNPTKPTSKPTHSAPPSSPPTLNPTKPTENNCDSINEISKPRRRWKTCKKEPGCSWKKGICKEKETVDCFSLKRKQCRNKSSGARRQCFWNRTFGCLPRK